MAGGTDGDSFESAVAVISRWPSTDGDGVRSCCSGWALREKKPKTIVRTTRNEKEGDEEKRKMERRQADK